MSFTVVEPGLLTTVQDGGRPGLGSLGVPRSGACDPWSLAVANALVGNPPTAAALELTLVGPTLRAEATMTIGLAGADLGGVAGGRRLRPGTSCTIPAGATIAFPGPAHRTPSSGVRAYLAVPGGFDVPLVLGSRSTCLPGGFGGVDGRPLASGDRLRAQQTATGPDRSWPAVAAPDREDGSVRVLPGLAGHDAFEAFVAAPWRVAPASDRMGLRLTGSSLAPDDRAAAPAPYASHGVTWGTVQLPPDGQPIVLLADHQPTGGYPVVAIAIAADRPVLCQAGPGDELRFRPVSRDAAVAALVEAEATFRRGLTALSDGAKWDDLAHWAGG